ncbi:MAG: hypothetical protein ACI4NG_05350 [Candidatus Gallimonas sp.]
MKELLTLSFSVGNDLMTTVRLATGGICSLVGIDLDESEDCKVCVTEGLLILRRNGYSTARVVFSQDDGVSVRLVGLDRGGEGEPSVEDDISYALLEALVNELNVEKDGERLCALNFRIGC